MIGSADAYSRDEIVKRVALELQELREKYPHGAAFQIERINRHEHMSFLYPEDRNVPGIGVLNEWADRYQVRLPGYFILTDNGYLAWLPSHLAIGR